MHHNLDVFNDLTRGIAAIESRWCKYRVVTYDEEQSSNCGIGKRLANSLDGTDVAGRTNSVFLLLSYDATVIADSDPTASRWKYSTKVHALNLQNMVGCATMLSMLN
ncbi:unnamed protein product [Soboliphyme baturini]|uniref:Uncharacterized protein n=1 Tax=Soboliphyme baturini TaxID=241478 RepID=A0A183IZE6_9BILA|nr:unnamed protein product [Soboliphyme baturini]